MTVAAEWDRARDALAALTDGAAVDAEPEFLKELRREARAAFYEVGLPHTRLEEWRYTNLAPLLETEFALGAPAAEVHPGRAGRVLVRDGHPVDASGATVPGVRVRSLAEAARSEPGRVARFLGRCVEPKRHPLAALNTAAMRDGLWIHFEATGEVGGLEVVCEETTGSGALLSCPRILVTGEPRSVGRLAIEERGSGPRSWSNAVLEVFLEEESALDLIQTQRVNGFSTSFVAVEQTRSSRLSSWVVSLGGRVTRQDLSVRLAGEGAEARLRGLFVASGTSVVDHHTWVDHAVPHCRSDQLYKGIASGEARGVFRGRVLVRPDAQHTHALQSNPNLLIGSRAEVDTKPQLEIYADDVRCSHGSSVGQMSEEALFYLRTRGLDPTVARELLVRGFAAEALHGLDDPQLVDALLDDAFAICASEVA